MEVAAPRVPHSARLLREYLLMVPGCTASPLLVGWNLEPSLAGLTGALGIY